MKKQLLSLLALALGIGMAVANPVDQSRAKYVGQQFVQANFDQSRANGELNLVYTATSKRGEACFYVYNVGSEGFVVISADDFYRPVLGYSEQGSFDARNINPALAMMLDGIVYSRSNHLHGDAEPGVAAEWDMVMNNGSLRNVYGNRADSYLVSTTWNQDSPYNYLCPSAAGGPGGRAYAGCVATAMSQVMNFWQHPAQGTGSHSYTCPGIGPMSANFGNTTYDWNNMPKSIGNNSPQEEIMAIATLMYQCGIAVDMHYAADGSGSQSTYVPGAISNYFGYTGASVYRDRSTYSRAAWNTMLRESFDMGWPIYYSGCDSEGGCHAFVCDGYNAAGLMHWNWGWSGSGDGWFDFDSMDYSYTRGAAVFNFVPTSVYNSTSQAPAGFNVVPADNNQLSATLTWINPSNTMNNSQLSTIDQIVVERNGEIIYTQNNVTPGASMTFTDNSVPRFDSFDYAVYAVCNGSHGKVAWKQNVSFGPTCSWTMMLTTTSMQGWRGAAINIYNAAGTKVGSYTTSSTNSTVNIDVPVGFVSFGWTAPTEELASMGIIIKNSQNASVYTYNGSSANMEEGIFLRTNNSCGANVATSVPSNLFAVVDDANHSNINVSWDGVNEEGYGYVVYRDNVLYRLIPTATSFVDENASQGGHCYRVGFMGFGGENGEYSNESCAVSGDGCDPATDLDYEQTGSAFKTKLKWAKPANAEGLAGYYIMRKAGDGEYTRIKLAGANATSYTDNSTLEEGHYYYKVIAYYQAIDCASAPAAWVGDDNQYFLHVYYSPTSVAEMEAENVMMYPNPTKDNFTVEAVDLTHISVFNTLGQIVYETECDGNMAVINMSNVESGMYLVRIATKSGEITKRISVVK